MIAPRKTEYKTLPKFYQGMLYSTVNFIHQHIEDPVQKRDLYAKLPIHNVTIADQIFYFDSHCDLRKTEKEIYNKLKQEHKERQKPKSKPKPKSKLKQETKTKSTSAAAVAEEPTEMYLYKIDSVRYWTPDSDLQNGPLYSSVKDQDGDPSPSNIQVGVLKNGVGILKS